MNHLTNLLTNQIRPEDMHLFLVESKSKLCFFKFHLVFPILFYSLKIFEDVNFSKTAMELSCACHVEIKVLMSGLEFPPERVTYICMEAQISSWKTKRPFSHMHTETTQHFLISNIWCLGIPVINQSMLVCPHGKKKYLISLFLPDWKRPKASSSNVLPSANDSVHTSLPSNCLDSAYKTLFWVNCVSVENIIAFVGGWNSKKKSASTLGAGRGTLCCRDHISPPSAPCLV